MLPHSPSGIDPSPAALVFPATTEGMATVERAVVTIRDVAARAGVSRSSVSRFLNGYTVREARAISVAIEELGYEPSPIARSLRSGRTRSVGVIVADVANPFFAAAFKGIESVARRERDGDPHPVQLFLCNTEESMERLQELLDGLAGRVDGLVIAPPTETPPPEDLVQQRIPVVQLDRVFAGEPFADAVLVDNEGSMAEVVRHLADLGHERIGFISGPLDTTPGRGRYEGYCQGLAEAGLPMRDELVALGDFKKDSGHVGAIRLLNLEHRPTALVAANNLMALGALSELAVRGLRIPDEMSFASFDDLEEAPLLRPAISTVSRPMEEQGARAMELLLARLQGDDRPPHQIVLPTRYVPRESVGPPPAGS